MSDESDGLIERAAALLRQRGSPRSDGDAAAGRDRRTIPGEDPAGLDHPGPPVRFDPGPQPIPAPIVEHEELSLRRLLRTASLHKFAFLCTALPLFAVSAAAILGMTPRYTAMAVVAIGNHAPSAATRIATDVAGEVVQFSPDAAAVRTQVDYLQSRPVAESAMEALHLWHLPEFDPAAPQSGLRAAIGRWFGPAISLLHEWRARLSGSPSSGNLAADERTRREAAVDAFLAKLAVDAKPSSQIITVQFQDADPELAAAAANAVASQYIARQLATASATAQQATAGLEQAVAVLRQRVAQSDQAYEKYRGSFESYAGRELLSRQTEEATKQLTTALIDRQVLEARLAALRGLAARSPVAGATSEVTGSRVMQALHEQAAVLQGRLAELSATLGPANPKVQEVEAAIAKVQGQMHGEVARQTAAVEADLKVARAREASVRQSLAANRSETAQSSGGQARLDALKVEADSNRAVLNAFLTRLHEANTSAKLLQPANAEIVAPASVPRSPSFPRTKMLLAVAAIGSTIAGFGVAVARERAAPTFRSSEEIEVETGIRTMALVPLFDNATALPEEVLASPTSFYAEAVRTLYMTLLLRRGLKVFVVTSARAGDGKTTLAASLALIAAKAGRKVLLVDADLCTAGASRMFRLAGQDGVAELIAGERRFADVVATAGADPNFHFIGAGAPGKVLAARSNLEGVGGLLGRLREVYDLIVVDSPPVLAVADAMALSAHADAALFAVRWGSTPRAAVKLGLKRLHAAAQGTSVGVVLTMVHARTHSRFGYADSALYTKDLVNYYGPGAPGAVAPPAARRADSIGGA